MPQWKKAVEAQLVKSDVLHHISGERSYNRGVSLNSCPNCGNSLPASTKKQLELGYRVYCPTHGCFFPLFTFTTVQEGSLETAEPPKIREKLYDASKASKIREKVPKPSKSTKSTQSAVPSETPRISKAADLSHCPHCNYPLTNTQLKVKQTGKKVMCRKCFELI